MKNQYNFNNFFKKNGYCVIPLFDTKTFTTLKKIVHDKINLSLNKIGKVKKLSDLKKYHNLKLNENEHLFMVKNSSRFIKLNSKVINKIKKNKKFTNLLHNYWGHSNMLIRWVGALEKKNSLKNNATAFRVARPKPCKDVGGVHYDLPFGRQKVPNKDQKALVTIWCPIEGFSERYTLKLAPKSHLKHHNLSKISKQTKFLSPVFKKQYIKKFKYFRPRLKKR